MNYTSINASLLRAVNLANPELQYTLQLEDVRFSNPELYLQGACNSRIQIIARDGNVRFKNAGYVFYNRRRLDRFLTGIRVPGKPSDYNFTTEVVEALRDQYRLPLLPDEFITGGISSTVVSLQPLNHCVGFFTNFPAVLPFTDNS